jgi:hypothetical protein
VLGIIVYDIASGAGTTALSPGHDFTAAMQVRQIRITGIEKRKPFMPLRENMNGMNGHERFFV